LQWSGISLAQHEGAVNWNLEGKPLGCSGMDILMVFRFFESSRTHLHSKFRKNANKSKTKFFLQKFNMGIKSVEKDFKKCTKKVFSKT
jgi:hypothetical protein